MSLSRELLFLLEAMPTKSKPTHTAGEDKEEAARLSTSKRPRRRKGKEGARL
jgi:hypothetical protein